MLSFTINWVLVLTLVVTIILPVLVGLVTKVETNPNVKALLLAALSAIVGLGSEVLTAMNTNAPYDLGAGLIKFVGIFVVAVAIHYGFWKPTGVATAAQGVGSTSTTVGDHEGVTDAR